MLKTFFLNLRRLFDEGIVSITKKEYGSFVHSLKMLAEFLVLMPDE